MTDKVTCFLPCRAGSQRVPRKNIKPFAGYEHGLLEIKLQQLLSAEGIDEVVLTTNDSDILTYAESLDEPRLRLHRRVEELSSSATSTDQLVAHALDLIPKGHVLWTHVTSPFVTAELYDEIIDSYLDGLKKGCDSLMTTTTIHNFLWDMQGPINYDRSLEKWPRTQTLEPLHEVNSAVFLAPTEVYSTYNDRIGLHPKLVSLERIQGFDIDWEADFAIAEAILQAGLVQV